MLEMEGAILLTKWVARHARFHGLRLLVLLDAKAVLYGILKACSSSYKLGRLLQRLGAYIIAADLAPRLLYVPTEDMPVDAPSRGVRAGPKKAAATKTTRLQQS